MMIEWRVRLLDIALDACILLHGVDAVMLVLFFSRIMSGSEWVEEKI